MSARPETRCGTCGKGGRGAEGQAEPRRGGMQGAHRPDPPAIPAPHLLRSLFFSFRLFLGLRDLQEEPQAEETGVQAAPGGLPCVPPEATEAAGGEMGLTCQELGSTKLQTTVGGPAVFGGTVGSTCQSTRLDGRGWQWEGRTGSARHPQGSGLLSPLRSPCPSISLP